MLVDALMNTDPAASRSPEREVLLLAARPGEDPAVRARLETLLSGGLDWYVLVRLASEHRLVPLLDARLRPIGAPRVPGDITHALGYRAARNEERGRLFERAIVEVSGALRGLGIEALVVQGTTLARRAYGNPELQEAVIPAVFLRRSDLDRFHGLMTQRRWLLQKPHLVPEALSTTPPGAVHRIYFRAEDEAVIEARTALLAAATETSFDEAGLWHRAVDWPAGDARLRTLSLEDLVLVLCASGDAREWSVLGELCDLAWLVHRHPEIDLAAVRARAQALNLERSLLVGLGLARQVLGVSPAGALTEPDGVRQSVQEVSAQLLSDQPGSPVGSGFSRPQPQSASQAASLATARNKAHWGSRSDAWDKWSERTRPRSEEVSRALIAAAGVGAGHRVLDLACGVGDTSLALAPLVGARGLVFTTDLAFDMVSRARQRAIDDGLANLRYCGAAMEALPFGEGQFDGIVCRLGIMYSPLVQRALAEARRVLRPGARAAFLVCGPREDNPILKIVNEVVTELFELDKGDGAIDPFRFAAAGSLAKEMAQAGFADVEEEDLRLAQRAPYGTPFWQPSVERGVSLALEALPAGTRRELERRMAAAFEPYARSGFYELTSLSRITRGARPR